LKRFEILTDVVKFPHLILEGLDVAFFALPERTLLFNKDLVSCLCHPDFGKLILTSKITTSYLYPRTHESHIPGLFCFAPRALRSTIRASHPSYHRSHYHRLHYHQRSGSLSQWSQLQDRYCDDEDFQRWTIDALVYDWEHGGSGLGQATALEELTAYVCQQNYNGLDSYRMITHSCPRHSLAMGSQQSRSPDCDCGGCFAYLSRCPHWMRRWRKGWLHSDQMIDRSPT